MIKTGWAQAHPVFVLFGMELAYEKTIAGINNTPLYKGNIGAIKWSNNLALGTTKDVAYKYGYDTLNRLKSASYLTNPGTWTTSTNFAESGFKYDLNGNILALQRTDANGTTMDQLKYTYDPVRGGNQLKAVSDDGSTSGFKDGNKTGNDYSYDVNGNMTVDKNKSITAITYNYLNLPSQVTKSTGEKIVYTYDAGGRKLKQQVYNASGTLTKTTDYVGEFIYQNDTLQFINHEEGRVVMNQPALQSGGTTEYQYHLKDHLGNVRMTFTAQPVTDQPVATLEDVNAITEQSKFLRYSSARLVNSSIFDHTNNTAGNTTGKAERLSGSANEKFGLARSISVMPGDVVNAEVYAKYVDPSSVDNTTTAGQNLLSLLSQIGAASAGVVIDGSAYSSSTASFPSGLAGLVTKTDDGAPKAYLNWLLFDRNYMFITGGFKQITTQAKETGTDGSHEYVTSGDILITQPGYVYIYLSNESLTPVEVYFDDFKVTQAKSPVVQMEDFYPFGLTFNSYQRESTVENRYLYNQGKGENTFKTERVYDLGLNVDQSRDRTYDYITGRWWQLDPLADLPEQVSQSPYQYGWNNPIKYNDPNGDCPCLIPAIPWVAAAIEALFTTAIVGTAGYIAYDSYDRSQYKAQTLQTHNEGSFLNGRDPKNPNFDASKKAALVATAVALVSRLIEKNAKFAGLDPREMENKLSTMNEHELQLFIDNGRNALDPHENDLTDRQFFGVINPSLVLSAATYDIKKDAYSLKRGLNPNEQKAQDEEREKGKQAKQMLNNFSNLEQGTYTWNGSKWELKK